MAGTSESGSEDETEEDDDDEYTETATHSESEFASQSTRGTGAEHQTEEQRHPIDKAQFLELMREKRLLPQVNHLSTHDEVKSFSVSAGSDGRLDPVCAELEVCLNR